MYETKDLSITLEDQKPTNVVLDTIKADVTLQSQGEKAKALSISNIVVQENGRSVVVPKVLTVSGKTLTQYIKVVRNEDGVFEFKVNPISLLTKLSTLRRAC